MGLLEIDRRCRCNDASCSAYRTGGRCCDWSAAGKPISRLSSESPEYLCSSVLKSVYRYPFPPKENRFACIVSRPRGALEYNRTYLGFVATWPRVTAISGRVCSSGKNVGRLVYSFFLILMQNRTYSLLTWTGIRFVVCVLRPVSTRGISIPSRCFNRKTICHSHGQKYCEVWKYSLTSVLECILFHKLSR